jgi:telomerase reverse transcriptase
MSQRACYSDSIKRRELVEEFLYWYFNSFLIPLLKVGDDNSSTSAVHTPFCQNTFYCTESSAYRNKVLYFRQDDWQTLCQPLIERLVSVTFEKLPSVSRYCLIAFYCISFFEVRRSFGH